MTYLILILAFVIGAFIGVFLFADVLKLMHSERQAGVIGKTILWIVLALAVVYFLLLIYPYADLGFAVGLLFGLGCNLYRPSQDKQSRENG